MNVHMEMSEALAKVRPTIMVGVTYPFYSDCVLCKTDNDELIRSYSGQHVTVIEQRTVRDEDALAQYTVRAANGDTFIANEGELNGWIFDTGQWVGPRIN
jgi:hypothetical protein